MTWRAYSGRVTFLPLASDAKEPARDLLDLLHRTAGGRAELRLLPAVRPFQHGPDFAAGDKLVVEAEATPLYDGYLYVDFVQHDGTILHLVLGPDRHNNAVKAGERVLIGNGPREYTIAPPYGTELLIVMSSPTPLFKSPRPQIEEAKSYLDELSRALEATGKQAGASPVVSNFSSLPQVLVRRRSDVRRQVGPATAPLEVAWPVFLSSFHVAPDRCLSAKLPGSPAASDRLKDTVRKAKNLRNE